MAERSRFEPIAQQVFLKYASIGGRKVNLTDHVLEGAKFLKIMRESKLMGGKLDAPKVDVIFMRVSKSKQLELLVSNAGKRITYDQFLLALAAVAEVKGMTEDQVFIKLVNADPTAAATQPEYVKFHDDKNLYTGMYT